MKFFYSALDTETIIKRIFFSVLDTESTIKLKYMVLKYSHYSNLKKLKTGIKFDI